MSAKQTTMIFVGAAALAAWFSAAMTPGRPAAPSIVQAPAPIDDKGAALAAEIARLHDRLKPDVTPRQASRNPFVFRSTPRTAADLRPRTAARTDVSVEGATVAEPEPPRLTLAGIAEDPGADGGPPVRTAIIAGEGQLFLVKVGDVVAVRARESGASIEYRVADVSVDGAELVEVRDRSIRRLTLR
jgi:hypothetical protein